jgi:uncharacterized iron-regulated membrane protein
VNQPAWRKWHRWVGIVSAPFVVFAAVTGVFAAIAESFGPDEVAREAARDRISPVKLPTTPAVAAGPISRALTGAAERAPGAPVDRIVVDFKTEPPTVTISLGKPTGGEDRKLVFDARTGAFLRDEQYEDKPFLVRLHSGEAFGDWGLVGGMLWGTALAGVTVSGVVIYFAMRRPGKRLGRVFW